MRILSQTDWCLFGATDVSDGPFPPLSFATDDPSHPLTLRFMEHLRGVLVQHGIEPESIAGARLCHGADVARVTRGGSTIFSNIDGLATNERGLLLAITGADCAPIFVADQTTKSVGLAHSGRKGTQANIAEKLVRAMSDAYGTKPNDLSAVIGPGICVDHYPVSEEIAAAFPSLFVRGTHLDLPSMIASELRDAGIPEERITNTQECTIEHPDRWFSWRRDAADGRPLEQIRLQVFFALVK